MDCNYLEQLTHLIARNQSLKCGPDLARTIGVRQGQCSCPRFNTKADQPFSLGDDRSDRRAFAARSSPNGFKIDMAGEVLLARLGKYGCKTVLADRLQSLTRTCSFVTIVDEQGRAPKFHQVARNRGNRLVASWRCLDDFTAAVEGEAACSAHHMPFQTAHMLPHPQS